MPTRPLPPPSKIRREWDLPPAIATDIASDAEIWRLISKFRSDCEMPPIPPPRLTFRQYLEISPTLQVFVAFAAGAVSMTGLLALLRILHP